MVERIACLGYYLGEFRGTKHFKTADIVWLNTEAAAGRITNASRDMDNADRHSGYIVSAGSGKKQLTVRGEAVVRALPDREAVQAAMKEHPHRPKRGPGANRKKRDQNGSADA
jgi:hypothetical protein